MLALALKPNAQKQKQKATPSNKTERFFIGRIE
jgi:hypothetical protein